MMKTTNKRPKVDVLDILSFYNIEIVLRGEEAQFKCPFHNDSDPSASFNLISCRWTCYRCKIGGSAIDFVSRSEGWNHKRSDLWLRDRYGGFVKPRSLLAEVDHFLDKAEIVYYKEQVLKNFKTETDFWDSRGIDKKTVKFFELGYDRKTDRATIPMRDLNGRLVGVQGRLVGHNPKQPKYTFIKNAPKNKFLYAQDKIESDYVVVVESAIAAIRMNMLGIPTVSSLGSSISDKQAELLNGFSKVYVLFDNDEAGWIGMLGNTEKRRFNNAAWNKIKTKVYIPSSDDYDDIDLLTKGEILDIVNNSMNAHVHVPLALSKAFSNA